LIIYNFNFKGDHNGKKYQTTCLSGKRSRKSKNFLQQVFRSRTIFDSPYYVGYKIGDLEVGLDPNSKVGPISYTGVGAEIVQDIKDVANGLLIAQLKDTNGNVVGLRQQT